MYKSISQRTEVQGNDGTELIVAQGNRFDETISSGTGLAAGAIMEAWRRDYNMVRPHNSLGYRKSGQAVAEKVALAVGPSYHWTSSWGAVPSDGAVDTLSTVHDDREVRLAAISRTCGT